MRAALAVGLVAALSGSGCLVLTLQPAYENDSVVFDETLVGRWENGEDLTAVVIERAEWRSYKLTYIEKSTTLVLHGTLTDTAAARFLDVTEAPGLDQAPFLVPVHMVYRIAVDGDTLTAAALDYGWMIDALSHKTLAKLAVSLDGRQNAVVTSSTAELRAWLARAPADAFGAAMTFRRAAAR